METLMANTTKSVPVDRFFDNTDTLL